MSVSAHVEIEEYLDDEGRNPFNEWYRKLDPASARTVENAISKRARGITGTSKHVKGGVHELRPSGIRIYYGIELTTYQFSFGQQN